MFQIGDTVEDFTFFQADGSTVRLTELVRGPVLLVFLRHLG